MTSSVIGVNLTQTIAAAELQSSGRGFGLGDRYTDHDGKEWVFVRASAAVAQFDSVTYDETYGTVVAPLSTANDARGDLVGAAPVAIAAGDYGWLQVRGPCSVNVKASCAANVRLNTTASAGLLDDDGTAGAMQVEGFYLTGARGGTDGPAPAILNAPIVGATL
jgi:hypothetical protein